MKIQKSRRGRQVNVNADALLRVTKIWVYATSHGKKSFMIGNSWRKNKHKMKLT